MDNKETRDYHECMTYTTRKFAEGSKLHCYLKKKYRIGIFNSPFTQVYTVCNALRKIILEERLFDPQNPSIIICNEELENALDQKAIHESELKRNVCKQLFVVNSPEDARLGSQARKLIDEKNDTLWTPSWGSENATMVELRRRDQELLAKGLKFDTEGEYFVTPELLRAIRQVEGVDQNKTIFLYGDISKLMSRYIVMNSHNFFDMRNVRICLIENDILRVAFKVSAFDRNQITSLLRSQLIFFRKNQEDNNKDNPADAEDNRVDTVIETMGTESGAASRCDEESVIKQAELDAESDSEPENKRRRRH
jgi:hypothetical protein